MGNSYQRQDVSNNIANGNIINADDLDAEFNALEGAFTAVTGHSHDGTAGEGGPISQVGPAQDLIVSASQVLPKTDNTLDLGSTSFEFKDLWIDGTANIDSLVADTADINGGTVDGAIIGGTTPAAGTFTSVVATTADINGGTVDNTVIGGATPAAGTFTAVVATTADINAGTIDNTVIGGTTPAAGTFTAVTATTADINGGTVDATVIGGSTPAAGTFTTATATSGVVNANSSGAALRVTQVGTGPALLVEDSSNPDSTPFIVAADGAVAIGTLTTPSYTNFGSLTIDGTQGGGIDLRRAGALEGEIFIGDTGKLILNNSGAGAEFRLNMGGTTRFRVDTNGNAALNGAFSVLAGDTVFAINSDTQDANLRMRYLDSTVAVFRTQTNNSAFLGTDIAVPMRLGSNGTTVIRIGGATQNLSIGRGNADGDAAAVVDIGGTTKGLLIPRLSTTQRNAIAAVPTGLLIYNTTLNQLEHFNGAVWGPVGSAPSNLTTAEFAAATLVTAAESIGANNNDTTIPTSAAVKAYADSVVRGGAPDFVLEDQKAAGVSGQSITASAWAIRDLNTEVRDISGIVSISSNQFTVTANCWVEWTAPGIQTFKTRLYNVTDALVSAVGEVSGPTSGKSTGGGECLAGKTYRIEQYQNSTGVTQAALGTSTEVYTRVRGWRT